MANRKTRRRRKVGGLGTGGTIALVGGGLVVLYLLTKKQTPTPVLVQAPGTLSTNPAVAEVSAGASIANNLINSIFS